MSVPPTTRETPFPYFALGTLALAIFLSVTIEMLPTGLLPDMSADLGVTESMIGLTVSVFAFTVVLTSTTLAHLTRAIDRHRLVVILLLIFVASTVLTACAPTYEVLVASRVMGGLTHGLFWAVVGAYSAYLVPPEQIGKAVAIALGGGSLAFVFGVPLGTALGHAVGWRMAFAVLAGLILLGTFFVWRFLPKVSQTPATASIPTVSTSTGGIAVVSLDASKGRHHSVLAVVFVCSITAITMIGQYTFYTFIAPFVEREMGLGRDAVSPVLFGYGVMGALALVLVAWYFGSRPRRGLMTGLVTILLCMVMLIVWPQVTPVAVGTVLVWGLAMGMLPPLLQTRLLHAAPARIRDTASAFYTTAFNIGIGGGAFVGAWALDEFGLSSLPILYAGIIGIAILVVVVSDAVLARPSRTSTR